MNTQTKMKVERRLAQFAFKGFYIFMNRFYMSFKARFQSKSFVTYLAFKVSYFFDGQFSHVLGEFPSLQKTCGKCGIESLLFFDEQFSNVLRDD